MTLILRLLATAVFIGSFFFFLREPISLVWVVAITLLILNYSNKMAPEVSPILVIALCLVSLFWVNSQTPIWGDEYAEKQDRQQIIEQAKKEDMQQREFVSKAQYAVKVNLKDPGSAAFSSDSYHSSNGSSFACGYVNAKNSFGAMAGNKRYISDGTPAGSYIDDGSSGFEETWKLRCSN
ncbi:conserved membrane hypothetical protein [Pantoea brenneri]|uniref:Uncharacterized protein n=1 Tax=Pantoea brenneri TaxID=472694 RepID=A0AAX3J5U1_9GAMM|nr:hypothetical protein [Pantoea brenneri]VXB76145.1 conserved membrane hypothetical protein [Pantoea brenneri]